MKLRRLVSVGLVAGASFFSLALQGAPPGREQPQATLPNPMNAASATATIFEDAGAGGSGLTDSQAENNICCSGPAQGLPCTLAAQCNDVCDIASDNVGASCSVDGDCPGGACDHTGGAVCDEPTICQTQACCDEATGICVETLEPTCDVGTPQGFGTSCEPNCCPQPLSSYTGADECNLVGLHNITVPLLGSVPGYVTVTITGDNSAATNDVAINPETGERVCDAWSETSEELGWWEGFVVNNDDGGPGCFNVRVDFCCTDINGEPLRPAWGNLVTGCDPCGDIVSPAGVDYPIGAGDGSVIYDWLRFCNEDNMWTTFGPLPVGAYYYPVYTMPNGTSGVPPGATYQLHITVGPCPVAACCSGADCAVLTEIECAAQDPPGYWLVPPNVPAIVIDCDAPVTFCDTGSCCPGPGICIDEVMGAPMTLAECDTLGGSYVGGANCDNPGRPCPLCEIEDASSCQLLERYDLFVALSDVSAPGGATVLADNFIPTGNSASTVCVWGVFLDGKNPRGQYGCTEDLAALGVDYNFTVKIFGDANGMPDTSNLIGERAITSFHMAEKRDGVGIYNEVYGATGFGDAGENAWAFQLELDPPITGLALGQCHWLEVSANTANAPTEPQNSCEFNLLIKQDGYNPTGFSMTGTWDDNGNSVYAAGGGRPFDYAFCIDCGIDVAGCAPVQGACCSCYDAGAVCVVSEFDACIETGMWDQPVDTCVEYVCETTAPLGDTCGDSIVIGDGSYFFDSTCASTTVELIQGEGGYDVVFGSEIWFDYTATCTGTMRVSMCGTGSNYDSMVATFNNYLDPKGKACPGDAEFAQVGRGSDESCTGIFDAGAGWLERAVEPGDRFLIAVGGYKEAAGPGQLNVECLTIPCAVAAAPLVEASTPDNGFGVRNRFLSFEVDPADIGRTMAVRVTFVSLPPPFDIWDGTQMWVREPSYASEASGIAGPGPVNLNRAALGCQEVFDDFSQYAGGVHVTHEAIVPGGMYNIQAIRDFSCSIANETNYSTPLILTTSAWGDIASCDTGGNCARSPNGIADFDDIVAIVDKFKNLPGAVSKSRADVAPGDVDDKVDFIDIPAVVDGFRGRSYPYYPSQGTPPCSP